MAPLTMISLPKSTLSVVTRDLARQITGRVSDPWDVEYKEAVQIDNGRIVHEPRIVVVPESVEDVQKTIAFCGKRGLRLTTKGGGHSAAGYCLNTGGVVLDLRRLDSIVFDESTGRLRVGLGCRWRAVYDFLMGGRTGFVPVGGGCLTVGLGGFLLGGGYSFLSRSYGLGCDNMLGVRMVTAEGQVVDAHRGAKTAPLRDLFWACCGGGGGNFGVGVEVELQAHRPKTEMMMGEITFPFYQVTDVLEFYNEWVEKLPDSMAVYGRIANVPDPREGGLPKLSLLLTPVYNGPFVDGVALLHELIRLEPLRVDLYKMTIPEWEEYIGARTAVAGRSAYIRSLVVPPHGLNTDVARVLKKFMAVSPSAETFIVWTHAGGAISSLNNDSTAFVHRGARFIPEVKAIWDPTRPQEMRRNVEWAYEFFEELAQASGATGAYLNYIDPLLSDWSRKYHGENYDHLLKVKKKWDPDNFFQFQQSIGSKFKPDPRAPLDLSPLWNS